MDLNHGVDGSLEGTVVFFHVYIAMYLIYEDALVWG